MALSKKDPEQAKSLLNEAASATEKLPDPYDQAECDGLIAGGFLLFDQDRAQQILKEALKLADQLAQEEEERKSNPKPPAGVATTFRSPQPLFSMLLSTLARLNIDDAMARAEGIKDKETKLRAMVQIANALLNQKSRETFVEALRGRSISNSRVNALREEILGRHGQRTWAGACSWGSCPSSLSGTGS